MAHHRWLCWIATEATSPGKACHGIDGLFSLIKFTWLKSGIPEFAMLDYQRDLYLWHTIYIYIHIYIYIRLLYLWHITICLSMTYTVDGCEIMHQKDAGETREIVGFVPSFSTGDSDFATIHSIIHILTVRFIGIYSKYMSIYDILPHVYLWHIVYDYVEVSQNRGTPSHHPL